MKKLMILSFILLYIICPTYSQWTGTNPLTTNSKVGIGTSNPSYLLHIHGKEGEGLRIQASKARFVMSDIASSIFMQMDNKGSLEFTDRNLQPFIHFDQQGKIGIGTNNPIYKLDVNGAIRASEIKVEVFSGSDFVFDKDYKLKKLEAVESFILENKHLPGIASEKEMINNGIDILKFQMQLLEKIEELTLYNIEQNKRLINQEEEINLLKSKVKLLESYNK